MTAILLIAVLEIFTSVPFHKLLAQDIIIPEDRTFVKPSSRQEHHGR